MGQIVYVKDINGNIVETEVRDEREERVKELEEENRKLREKLSEITMVADDEKQSIEHILELEEENKKLKEYNRRLKQGNDDLKEQNEKLKEDNRFLTKISKEYMEKENIIEVTEFTQLYKDELEEENKKLKEELKKYKKLHKYSNGELLTYSGD